MPEIVRGDHGQLRIKATIRVTPNDQPDDDIHVVLEAEDGQPQHGLPIRMLFSHDEAAGLCADLSAKLADLLKNADVTIRL